MCSFSWKSEAISLYDDLTCFDLWRSNYYMWRQTDFTIVFSMLKCPWVQFFIKIWGGPFLKLLPVLTSGGQTIICDAELISPLYSPCWKAPLCNFSSKSEGVHFWNFNLFRPLEVKLLYVTPNWFHHCMQSVKTPLCARFHQNLRVPECGAESAPHSAPHSWPSQILLKICTQLRLHIVITRLKCGWCHIHLIFWSTEVK